VTGRVRDRDVLLLMAGLVAAVLATNVLSAVIPGMDAALARAPILVLLLLGGTAVVLAGVIRRPPR